MLTSGAVNDGEVRAIADGTIMVRTVWIRSLSVGLEFRDGGCVTQFLAWRFTVLMTAASKVQVLDEVFDGIFGLW